MRKALVWLAVLAVAAALAFVLIPQRQAAPAFAAPDLQGQVWNEQQLQGKVSLLNFWFPSCPGCITEMPKLVRLAQDYRNTDFQIIGIAVPVDPIEHVHEYVATRKLPFRIVPDYERVITPLFVKTELYPTSVLINKRGEILKTFVGEPDFDKLRQEIDAELAK